MVEIPWPNIQTKFEEGGARKVPLKEDYAFKDMWYLDLSLIHI